MKIESNLLEISKVMFTNQQHWKFVNDEQKQQFFFIFNRYFARKYPDLSQLINDKLIDKSVGLDLWFNLMNGKPYPQWFWPKNKKNPKSDSDENILEEIRLQNNFTKDEFDFICRNYPQEIEEEIIYIKQKNGSTREKVVHRKGAK